MKTLGWIVAIIFVAGLVVAGCIAVVNDEDSWAPTVVASHEYGGCDPDWEDCGGYGGRGGQEYDYDYGSHDRNRNRGRDRGAFSPDLQDSPVTVIICPPGTQYCGTDGGREDGPPPGEGGYA